VRNAVITLILTVAILLQAITPVSAASFSYTWDENTRTVTIYKDTLFGKTTIIKIKQLSVETDLTSFTETLEITGLNDYTLSKKDLKWLWTKHKGKYDIHSFELQKLTNESYTVKVPDYETYNVSVPVYDETNTTVVSYRNETRKRVIGYHDETHYRKAFKKFIPSGKTLKKGESYTIKVTLRKKAELGESNIHLTPTICGLQIKELTWWNTSWQYKITSVLNNVPSGGYQYNLTIHSGSGTNNDTDVFLNGHNATNFDDIRFVLDDTTPLAYWIEDNTTDPIKVWVNVTDNGTVSLYYGNPDVSSASDGYSTFDFFDDFEDGVLGSQWNSTDGTGEYSESGGVMNLTVTGGTAPYTLYSSSSFTDFIMEGKWKVTSTTGVPHSIFKWRYTVGSGSREVAVRGGTSDDMYIHDGVSIGVVAYEDLEAHFDEWHFMQAKVNGTTVEMYVKNLVTGLEGNTSGTVTTTAPNPIGIASWDVVTTVFFDDIRVRKYADPEPVWSTWSSEEVKPPMDPRPLLDYNSQRKLARTSEGYLHRVYTKLDGVNYRVYYGKSTDNGNTWTETVLTDAGMNSNHPAIAVDSDDDIYVVYEREGSGIKYKIYQGTSWGSEKTLSSDLGETPSIAVDESDDIYVTWMANFSGTYKVRYSYYNGTAWNDTINITTSTENQKYPSIAIDPYSIHVVWQEYNTTSGVWNIKYRKYQSGWGSIYNITTNSTFNQVYPSIAVDLGNNVHVAWEDENAYQIKYKRYDYSTSSWGSIEVVADGGAYPQIKPSISVYSNSYVYMTWYGWTASSPNHWVIRSAYRTTSWSAISDVVTASGLNVTSPSSIYARYPVICSNIYTNIPESGYSFVYDRDGTITYYNASTWRGTDKYVVTIIAKDSDTGQVITNFTVDFSTGETKTTDNGAVKFRCLDSGYYQATVTATNYHPSQNSIVLDQSKELIVYLTPIEDITYVLPKSHLVEFYVVDKAGSPVEGVNVTAIGYETTMDDWSWLNSIFGFENVTEIQGTNMTGFTGTDGVISFMMVETIKYKITFVNASANINKTMYLYPKGDRYIITVGESYHWWSSEHNINEVINISVTTSKINSTHAYINVSYNDSLNITSNVSILLNQTNESDWLNQTILDSYYENNQGNVTHSFIIENYKGKSYFVRFIIDHNEFGEFIRDYAVKFKGLIGDLGWDEDVYPLLAFAIILFVGAMFGAVSAEQGALVCCGLGWIFYGIGWLNILGISAPIALTLATIIAIFANMIKRQRMEGIS
jgi:hypothetical protein